MSRLMRRSSLLGGLLALLAASPALAAAPIAGGVDDGAGDGGAADLQRVDVAFDGAGKLEVRARLAAAPTSGALLVVAGRTTDGGCQATVGLGAPFAASAAPGEWYTFASSGSSQPQGQTQRAQDGSTFTFTAQDARLADTGVDCALARTITESGDVLDETSRFGLAAASTPPPATTPTTPTTTSTTTPAPTPQPQPTTGATPTPVPTTSTTPTQPARTGAHLELALPAVANRGKRGVTRTLRIKVRNRGTATASKPVVRVTPPKGVSVSPRRRALASIKRGQTRSLTLRVEVTSKAKAASTIGVSVRTSSKGTARLATGRLLLPIKRPTVKVPVGGGGGTTGGGSGGGTTQPATPLAGKAFNSFVPDGLGGTRTDGLYFQDGTWAIRGTLDGGIPTCTARTADADGDGCVPYTYDPATKALTIDGKPATYKPESEGVELDGTTYGYFPLVPAGTALATDASYVSCTGFAPYATCATGQFIARPDGTFQTQGSASSSNPTGDVTAIGADKRGTYAVVAPGVLQLNYADGHQVVRVIQYFRDGTSGETNPTTRGLILDGSLYTTAD